MKKCKKCKEEIDYSSYNGIKTYKHKYGYCLKNKCYNWFLLNTDKGKSIIKKQVDSVTKTRKDFEKAKIRYQSQKKLPSKLTYTKNRVHKYVRERDKGLPCISCGTPYKDNFQAGHWFKAELHSSVRFNLDNINGQCEQCNLRKEGNVNNYEIGLINRIGIERVEKVKEIAKNERKVGFKWSIKELETICDNITKLMKQLKTQ